MGGDKLTKLTIDEKSTQILDKLEYPPVYDLNLPKYIK